MFTRSFTKTVRTSATTGVAGGADLDSLALPVGVATGSTAVVGDPAGTTGASAATVAEAAVGAICAVASATACGAPPTGRVEADAAVAAVAARLRARVDTASSRGAATGLALLSLSLGCVGSVTDFGRRLPRAPSVSGADIAGLVALPSSGGVGGALSLLLRAGVAGWSDSVPAWAALMAGGASAALDLLARGTATCGSGSGSASLCASLLAGAGGGDFAGRPLLRLGAAAGAGLMGDFASTWRFGGIRLP
jgi:hypothetical protein